VPAGAGARPALVRSLGALFRVLVPAPLWSRVRSSREVVVVPDHLLHRLPFEALVVQSAPEEPRFWLDDGPPLRYAASATTLLALAERRETSTRSGIVTVANPEWHGPGSVTPSLEPLPGSAREAEEVRAAWTRLGRAADVTSLEGAEAREPRVRSALPGARHIHLATHGLVDETRGELFATLALTPPRVDPSPQDDGLLQLHEILRLPLDAELALLSACESRVGELVAGEGVFALSRAFLIAGSRRVIASLWPVADEASAGLVARVFEGLARAEQAGEPLDHAANLALAKRQVRSQPTLADPFYWAPFVLEGTR
jgi:CHAT domain-containing protein